MLFHLKEPDYKNQAPNDIVTRIYGRSPEEVLSFLDYYSQKAKKDGLDSNSANLVWWMKRKFSEDNIEEVKKGKFCFVSGMLQIGKEVEDKPLFEEIPVSEDFTIYVPSENVGNFALYRKNIFNTKRGTLYKLRNPIDFFMNLSFVPEDIAQSIYSYDLTKYLQDVHRDIQKKAELSQHPNIKVDGLQRILSSEENIAGLSAHKN